jgi:long-chain acyl-CoA synthetase
VQTSDPTVPTQADPRCRAPDAEQARLARLMAAAPASVAAMFRNRVARTPDAEAYRSPDGAGGWRSFSWQQTQQLVDELAAGLIALDVQPEQRVAIVSSTRLDWVHADLAIMCAGAATSTVYPTSPSDDVRHILSDSGSRLAFVEDLEQLGKVTEHWAELPELRQVVLITGEPAAAGPLPDGVTVITMAELADRGRAHLAEHPEAVTERSAAVRPEHLATLIYTSGTTGRPKGVRLPNSCWVYTGMATLATGTIRPDDLSYVWLPLSHSFGKVLLAGQIAVGYASAVDGRIDQIVTNLPAVRPTGMGGAPRVYEKIYARVQTGVAAAGGARAAMFGWAFTVGLQVCAVREQGGRPGPALAAQQALADRLVFSKVRARFGGRVRHFISGAAPLNADIARWFDAAGLRILEGYGLTETSAASFVNRPYHYRFGTVGIPLPGTHVRLDTDGEILISSPGVMQGYHNLPDETSAVLTQDGWLRTGDIGEITPDGFLRITDRKKELIKTSGGKYVAPQGIESLFKSICPLASQIVVHGDGRNYVTALIALDPEEVAGWAAANGMTGRDYTEVVRSPQLHDVIAGYVDELNTRLPRWETVKRFALLDADLTVEDGSMTPSLKLKRRVVERRHADLLDSLYS